MHHYVHRYKVGDTPNLIEWVKVTRWPPNENLIEVIADFAKLDIYMVRVLPTADDRFKILCMLYPAEEGRSAAKQSLEVLALYDIKGYRCMHQYDKKSIYICLQRPEFFEEGGLQLVEDYND